MQKFKEYDLTEQKVINAFMPLLNLLGSDRDEFFNTAYQSGPLGGILFDLQKTPLLTVIKREVFVESFFGIYDFFTRPGTFEFYLLIFRTVWGENVDVQFSIPAPGRLHVDIEASANNLVQFSARSIISDVYVYDEIVDRNGDFIMFQTYQGIQSQGEVNEFLKEIYTAGIFVDINFTLVEEEP